MYSSVPMKEPADGFANLGASSSFAPGQRKRINFLAICLNVLSPWLIFCGLYAIISFRIHYEHPIKTFLTVLMCLGLAGLMAFLGFRSVARERDPMWYNFGAIAIFAAVLLAIIFGDINFKFNTQPLYAIENLNVYSSIDTSATKGQQVVDAGRIYFAEGTELDKHKAIGHKDGYMYCVAPIVMGSQPMQSYDFWAAGVGCCTGTAGDFQCGEFNNKHARAGLRMMREEDRDYFLLAVSQAEAAYNVIAPNPVFFYWMQDPAAEMDVYRSTGYNFFLAGIFTHLAMMVFCALFATVCFSKGVYM